MSRSKVGMHWCSIKIAAGENKNVEMCYLDDEAVWVYY